MQRVKMLWRTPLLLPKDAREGKSTSDMKLCEHPHAHCIIPFRIKKKCHVDLPTWKRQWRRQPDRKKRGQAGSQGTWARVPARRGLAGWPRSPGPHRPVHTARWPDSPVTLFSPLWLVPKPEWRAPAAQRPAAAPVGVSTFQE